MNEESVNNIMGYFNEVRAQRHTANVMSGYGVIQATNPSLSGHLSFNQQLIDKRIAAHTSSNSGQRHSNNEQVKLGTINTNDINTISHEALPKAQVLRPDIDDDEGVQIEHEDGQHDLNERD